MPEPRTSSRPHARPQVVVVTGSTGGIGRATARAYGARGAAVALLARGDVGLSGAAQEVREAGGTAITIVTDTADYGQVEAAAQQVEEQLGPIDVWVNVAFTSVFARFVDIQPDEYRRVTDVNYHGFANGTRAALDRMLPRDRGTIVHVGSTLAYRGIPLQTAYCGSKHAIQGFHESLRAELLHDRSQVHVTMVPMPAVNTPQFSWVLSRLADQAQPVPPIYQATLLANAVAPGLLDRYLARTGFSSQQTGEPKDPQQPANLWEPADGPGGRDFGAHGRFDGRSTSRSAQLWASQHHGVLAAAALSTAATAAGLWRRRR